MTYVYRNRVPATPASHERPHHRVYRNLYKAHHSAPYTCFYCEELMSTLDVVHHIDEDPWNNELENLSAAHSSCHNKHHHVGITMSDESNAQRSESLRATFGEWTDEQRQKRAEWTKQVWTGRKHRPEVIEKMKASARSRPRASCLGCRREMTVNGLKKHNNDKNCPTTIGNANASK